MAEKTPDEYPMARRTNPPVDPCEPLTVRRDGDRIWSHIRQRWLTEKPEERVRQEHVCVLVNEYGYGLDQMDEELSVTGRGAGQARADIVVWRSARDKADKKPPLIVVECKSDNVTIKADDYHQGDNELVERIRAARGHASTLTATASARYEKAMDEVDAMIRGTLPVGEVVS